MIKHRIKTSNFLSFNLLVFLFLLWTTYSISNKVFYPINSNMGLKSDYYMSFTSDLSYTLQNLNIKLSIPIQYELSQIQQSLQCYMSQTGAANSYYKLTSSQCFTQPNLNSSYSITGQIIVKLLKISSTVPIRIVFRNVVNPSVESSSFFTVCLRSGDHLLQCDKQFKMVTFTPTYPTISNAIPIRSLPEIAVVGQGTTYYFKLKTNIPTTLTNYNLNDQMAQIRVIFPNQFRSSSPICSLLQYNNITRTYNTIQTQTSVSPSRQYMVECKKIQKLLTDYVYYNSTSGFYELQFKIQNIENPFYANYFNGLSVQISRAGRNQIIQKIDFTQPLIITTEQIDGVVTQTNFMRNATNEYFFAINHDFSYDQKSKIRISIGNNTNWKIHNVKLMFGFQNSQFSIIKIENSLSVSTAQISNYSLASNQAQQFISVNLTSTSIVGDHPVRIQTFVDGKLSGTWNSIVKVNSTWGSFNRLSFSAVQQPVKLPVNKTGPLEFKLFLNYQLPESQNIENGSMVITFTPPIATPDPDIYGKVKCYFKATMQAAKCDYDNTDPTKTKVTIVSPPYDQFQYSQIPIIITTEGGIDQDHLGLTISPIVQRYNFDVFFYLYNSSVIPSQILFTNWVADAIQLNGTFTGTSLSWQCNQWTALHLHLTTPLLDSPTSREQRFVVQFLADKFSNVSGWQYGLGYDTQKIYKQFPCVIVGLVGTGIKCDLYNYVNTVGPYNKQHINSRYFGPYIMVYGFTQPVPTNSIVDIYLPGIKISNNIGVNALLSFSILQQTPGQSQPYIQLYHQYLNIFTTKAPPSITVTAQNSAMGQIQVQTANVYNFAWNPVNNTNIAYIKYDYSPIKRIPSLETKFNTCTGSVCYSSGHPNNWMVQIPSGGLTGNVSTSHSLTTNSGIMSMPFIDSLIEPYPVIVTTYDANGNTLQIINMTNDYIPQPMAGFFNLLASDMTIYAGLKQWYEIQFDTVTAVTSSYPFIRFKLSNELKFSTPEQCQSATIKEFNASGIQCDIVPGTNSSELFVWNIKSLAAGSTYQLKVRLQTTAPDYTVNITPTADVYLNHNQTLVDSLVGQKRFILLNQSQVPQLAKPQQFTINNPQILNQQIRINYIGRLYIDFYSTSDLTTNFKIKFPNHRYNLGIWKTPNFNDADPVVCMLNGKRFYCDPTNSPELSILIKGAQIVSGKNRLQLDTQYIAPYNGLVFPNCAGNYQIQFSTIANLTTIVQVQQNSFYIYIHPAPLEDLQIASIVKDINTQSVYIVNFTIPDPISLVNANHFTGNYSRIFIEFPTIVNGQRIFEDNLGAGYKGVLNERVGCAFKKGANYVLAQAGKILQCRLIPPEVPGAPVKVQIVNYDMLNATVDSVGVFIFKVRNPAIAVNSVEIKVKINQYSTAGQVYPIFQSDYIVFLDPRSQNTLPLNYSSTHRQTQSIFDTIFDVGNYSTVSIKAETINPTIALPFYMLVKLPQYLPVQDEQLSPAFLNCPSSNFEYCVTSPDVNYVLVKVITDASFFDVYIKNYPIGISQSHSYFYSMIIQQGRFAGNIQYNISASKRWPDIMGKSTFNYIEAVGLPQKIVKQKQRMHVAVSFTTKNYIPETGTIQISFPTSVTKIYPYCRSATANLSKLYAKSGLSGQIGCSVQNQNKWVITGFSEVLAGTTIIISGHIDLPVISGPLGLAQIITYADTHQTDIYKNGSRIDYATPRPYFDLNVKNTLAMNPNQNVFLTQRDVIRINDVGQFRLIFNFAQVLETTGFINLYFSMFDMQENPGGFTLNVNEKKVCEFIDISNQNRIGCQVTSEVQYPLGAPKYILMSLRTFQNLNTTATYELRLTTQKYSYPADPEGIRYPSVASTYKIDVQTKYSTATTVNTIQHLYLQVFSVQFKTLKVTQHNYIHNQYNLYWFQIQPTVSIQTDHQIVVQFPTKSNDGTTPLFTNNLGLFEYQNGNLVATDIFDSTIGGIKRDNTFMKCNIFHGDQTTGMPVKIVCGQFLFQINAGQTLRFAFGLTNPRLIRTQLSIPLTIYSVNPFNFQKTNYNLVNGAAYIYDTSNILAKPGFASTSSWQLQFQNDNFTIGDAHTFDLLPGDSYILKFNFPIRVNDNVGLCQDAFSSAPYGIAYYHQRLRVIVCKITNTLPNQITPTLATARLLITSFYTPWYYLTTAQQKIWAYSHYYSTSTSQVVQYTDLFPILPPRWVFSASFISTLTLTPIITHNTQCQRQDYIFTINLDSGGATDFNLQYTKQISIQIPMNTTVDYQIFSRDCVQHSTSEIQVRLCQVNQAARTIFIEIVPGMYSNNKVIAIQTKGLALRNPCTVNVAPNVNQFVVNFFSWENITTLDKRGNDRIYMRMNISNIAPLVLPTALGYIPEASNAANTYFYPFQWMQIPHERYFDQFLQYKDGQFSPFKFDIVFAPGIGNQSLGNYNTLTLYYGADFDIPLPQDQFIDDLKYNTQLCYLRSTRVSRCFNNYTAKSITMEFQFQLPPGEWINVYFSVQDPRDLEKNGFKYIGGDSDIANNVYLQLLPFGAAVSQIYKVPPFQAKQTNVDPLNTLLPQRAIVNGVIDYATTLTSQLNVLDMTFTINSTVTDIKGLKFQIPLVDQFGQQIFSNPNEAFMGLSDGDQYPCGNNDNTNIYTLKAKCYLFTGLNTVMGQPTIITFTDFNYTTQIKARLILKNPAVENKWFTIVVKAYKQSSGGQSSLIGHKYVGYWRFYNVFKTLNSAAGGLFTTVDAASNVHINTPNPILGGASASLIPLWMNSTTWLITGTGAIGSPVSVGQYVIFQGFLNDYDGGLIQQQICEVDWTTGNMQSDDMIIYKNRQLKQQKVFFIKKWDGAIWNMQYYKCKNYLKPFVLYIHNTKLVQSISTLTMPFANYNVSLQTLSTIRYHEVMKDKQYLQVDITTNINQAFARGLNWENQVDYILVVNLAGPISFEGSTACQAVGGFANYKGNPVNCIRISDLQLIINNFNQIIKSTIGYIIKIDIDVAMASATNPTGTTTVNMLLYAGQNARVNNHYMLYMDSNGYTTRYMQDWINPGFDNPVFSYRYSSSNTIYNAMSLFTPTWTIQPFSNINYGLGLDVTLRNVKLTTSQLSFTADIRPITSINWAVYQGMAVYFRFVFQGITFTCSSVSSFGGLHQGFSCGGGRNHFIFNSQQYSVNVGGYYPMTSLWSSISTTGWWYSSQTITFSGVINVINVQDVSETRQWIGLKVFFQTADYNWYQTLGSYYNSTGAYYYDNYYYYVYKTMRSYGEGYYTRENLFSSVSLSALSNLVDHETQLQVTMNNANIGFGPASLDKILLLEFNTNLQTMFPYINHTSTQSNHLIQCYCITSSQFNFSPANPHPNLQCNYKFLQGSYIRSAISVNVEVPLNYYVRCWFPGFKVTAPIGLRVTAKHINEGTNLASYPSTQNYYGGLRFTHSNFFNFNFGTIPNSAGVLQTPVLYDGTYISTVKQNFGASGGYKLNITLGSTLTNPIFYVNFQKAGPVPNSNFCVNQTIYQFCRIYSKKRNIMVAKYANPSDKGDFGSLSASMPLQKQPDLGTDYNMIVYAKQPGDSQYSHTTIFSRTTSSNFKPTNTTLSVFPDRVTSTNYNSFRSNLILSFMLEGHQILSFYQESAALEISYSNPAYLTGNNGCTVSTDQKNHDQQFSFYCEIDTINNKIIVQNRYYNRPFSAGSLIQVVVGVTNQAAPITFTLKLYKWYIDVNNYGLLIQSQATYQPYVLPANQNLITLDNIRTYPFYTRVYSDVYAPLRMNFKFPVTMATTLNFTLSNLTSFMILDDFNEIASFSLFQCYLKQFNTLPANTSPPQTNEFRNLKQNNQYYFIPTYCKLLNTSAISIQIPRNRQLANTKYYQLVVMPVSAVQTGFVDSLDPLVKLIVLPAPTSQHIFTTKPWMKNAFSLNSFWLVTSRPQQPTALQITFTANFASALDFPNHHLQIVFNNLDLDAISVPYNEMGQTVPCLLTPVTAFTTSAKGIQPPNCIVSYFDKKHEVIKIRVQNNGPFNSGAMFKLSLDYFLLPSLVSLLQQSNPFSICINYWSVSTEHEKCFGQLFTIDGYTNTLPINYPTDAVFNDPSGANLKHGTLVSPSISFSYPRDSNSSYDEKVMIRIKGGYSATRTAPVPFSGSAYLWHNQKLGLYIRKQNSIITPVTHSIAIASRTPYPYQMQQYMLGNFVQLTYYSQYHPHTRYTVTQTLYPKFIQNTPLVALGGSFSTDINTFIKSRTQATVKISIQIAQLYATLKLHENDRFQLQFTTNVVKVKRCWVTTPDALIPYSLSTICTPKPLVSNRLQLLNFFASNTNHNLTIYAVLQIIASPITIKSYLYAVNDQTQFTSTLLPSISSVSSSMTAYTELSFTQSHYSTGYFEQMIRPITHTPTNNVRFLYYSMFLTEDLVQDNSVFTIFFNATASIKPLNYTMNTRLICQWLKVNKFGRRYQTGKFTHCTYVFPNILIKAPTWNLTALDTSGNRIPYLLKIRQQAITTTQFLFPVSAQVEEMILSSDRNGLLSKDTLKIHPYQHFTNLKIVHTTLTAGQLNTYHVQFETPTIAVLAPTEQYVLTLQLDNKYLEDTVGIKDIYALYGQDSKNSSIVDNLKLNMVYTSLPNKWINGIPYSCWTNLDSAASQTCIQKSDKTIRINLLLVGSYAAKMIWKIPLLKNPVTQKPLRQNITLWSYPLGSTVGHKELFYQIINQYVTKVSATPATIDYNIAAAALANNKIQTLTNSLNVQFPTYIPNTNQIIQMKLLPRTTGLIDIPTMWNKNYTDLTYNFFFFENLNFLIAQKNVNDSIQLIDIGSFEPSNQFSDQYGYQWLKVHNKSSIETINVGAPLVKNIPECTIASIDFVLKSGWNSVKDSKFQGYFSFTTLCNISANSTLQLRGGVTDIQFLGNNDQLYCQTSFRSIDCWVDPSSKYLNIRIDELLLIGTLLQITTFIKSKSRATIKPINAIVYAIPGKKSTLVNTIGDTFILPVTTNTSLIYDSKVFPLIVKPLYQNQYSKLSGTFSAGHYPFTYLNIISKFPKLTTSNQTFYYQQNSTIGSQYNIYEEYFNNDWIRSSSSVLTNFDQTQTILPDGLNSYAIQTFKRYWFNIGSMYQTSGDKNNFFVGPVGKFYQFQYHSDVQIAYHEVYPVPIAQPLTLFNPLTQIRQQTVLGIQFFSLYQTIKPLDKIQIQLDAFNLIQDMYKFTDDPIQCIQFTRGILTNNVQLICEVIQYPNSTNNTPMKLYVYPTNTVAPNTTVKIWLSPVVNSPNVLVAGVTVKLLRYCSGQKLCTLYQGRGFHRTTNFMNVTDYGLGVATFSPAPNSVLDMNAKHTYTFNSIDLQTAFIKYPQNYQNVMALTCTSTSTCLVFPKQRKVVNFAMTPTTTTSLLINGLTNGIYVLPQNLLNLKLSSPTKLDRYIIDHGYLATRKVMPLLSNAANTFTITNMQGPGNIFLRNFWNIVKMEIKGLYTSQYIKAFYITAPVQIKQWDTTYCNATIKSPLHNPYPTRLQCAAINSTTIQIKIPEGVYYQPGISETQILTVLAKMWIVDFPTNMDILYVSPAIQSNYFHAYGSFMFTDTSYNYAITQATTNISISQHKTPFIGQAAFNTQSFEQRLASVNDKTTFDILIDPITTDPIDYIEVVIPEQFQYPNIEYHDMCKLIFRRTTDLTSCKQTRKDNRTIITMDINETQYDNGPRILQIASKNMTDWFTAPSLPGILYNMTISLYGVNGTLLQKQSTKNSSRIKGYDLKLPSINITNGRDQLQQQIYDISFLVGRQGIKQGYRGILSKGQYYSQLRIKFQTIEGYQYLLGGYYQDKDSIGCITSLVSINKQISCIFDKGTNINDQPMIIITGYEQVSPNATVRISLANIKNLPLSMRNTLAIEVKYHKVDTYSSFQEQEKYSFFMYEPTQAITDASSALNFSAPTSLVITYPGQTIVNQPTVLSIKLTPSKAILDYIVLKFPKFGLRDDYTRFKPVCNNCQKLQIFYRAQVIRIYPIGGIHNAGQTVTYLITGFPSTQYVVIDPAFSITLQGYTGLKIVNKQVVNIPLSMKGCKMNGGIITTTSPYGGDTGVNYKIQIQVNTSQLNRMNQNKQLNLNVYLPKQSPWFSPLSTCKVVSPLQCSLDAIQKRIIIKNILKYNNTKSSITIDTFNLINPSSILSQTTLLFNSTLYEYYPLANQQNLICQGQFNFMYLPSPPNKCSMSLKSQHLSATLPNTLSFGVVCQQNIKDSSLVYVSIPRQLTFNNPTSNVYKCWTTSASMLLNSSCRIVFINGKFYFKTESTLNIGSNILQFQLNINLNNPLVPNVYVFGILLQHSSNIYSTTNNVNLTFYTPSIQPQLNSSISLNVVPQQAGAQAIYVLRVPTQIMNDKLMLSFGQLNIQLDPAVTKISYFQSANQTSTSSTSSWLNQQSYFSLLQQSYNNQLKYSTTTNSDLSQNIFVDTSSINNTVSKNTGIQNGWTYVMISPVINPSSSSINDTLKLKIYDTINTTTTSYDTLKAEYNVITNLKIQNPPAHIYQTKYKVRQNDISEMTQHNVTFTVDRKLFANQNAVQNVEFILQPPTKNSLAYLQSVQICLYYPQNSSVIECQNTIIGKQQLLFKPTSTNLTILADTAFKLQIKNISNPQNQTFCALKTATEKDYLNSYFQLKIFINKQLQYQSVFVGMIDDTLKPCVQFRNKKGDVLNNLPGFIYAGFETDFNITVTQSTANLRVFISSNDSDVIFKPNLLYFNNYAVMSQQLKALVSSNVVNKSVQVTIKHQQTLGFQTFRYTSPFVVKVIAGKKQTVIVNEMQSGSVGYDIKVPIILSKPSVYDMTLLLKPDINSSILPYLNSFTFSSKQIVIPALSQIAYFTVRYNGTKIPPTLNISLELISQNALTHYLLKDKIYLYFAVDPKFQTLPPIMKMSLMWLYKANKDQQSKTVYYCCANTTQKLKYDQLRPFIIQTNITKLTSTKATVQIWTRNPATLYYQIKQKGRNFELSNATSQSLRLDPNSSNVITIRNTSKLVNAYQLLNFTDLQHQTQYYLFVSANDPFGDSQNITVVQFKTTSLSNAIRFDLNCFQILTDEVSIVRNLADILQIDMRRIRVVSSQKNLLNSYSQNTQNKPVYPHQIVISPSNSDDDLSPMQLFKTKLLNNSANQALLKQKIPSWTGNFNSLSQYQARKPFYELNPFRPQFKVPPTALKISYYNATISVKFWNKVRVSAIMIVQQGKTPDNNIDFINKKPVGKKVSTLSAEQQKYSPGSKQIIKGLNQYSQKLQPKYTFTGLTNQAGQGTVFFRGLKPGSYCRVYITATNPQQFQPTLSLALPSGQVYMIDFNLMWNPNLKGNDHLMLQQIKKKNEKMYEVIKQYYENEETNKAGAKKRVLQQD